MAETIDEMESDKESYDNAQVEFTKVDKWCMANADEVDRALSLGMTARVSALAIAKILGGELKLTSIAGDVFAKVVNFGIAFGYYLAKTHDQGTKVPDAFKEPD